MRALLHRCANSLTSFVYRSIDDGIYEMALCQQPIYVKAPEGFISKQLTFADEAILSASFGASKAKEFLTRLDRCAGFAAYAPSGQIIGYFWITSQPRMEEGEPPFLYEVKPKPKHGYLFDMFVFPDFRRMGLARILMHNALLHARRSGLSFCYTIHDEKNHAMIKLSRSFGFKRAGIISYRRWGLWTFRNLSDLELI